MRCEGCGRGCGSEVTSYYIVELKVKLVSIPVNNVLYCVCGGV